MGNSLKQISGLYAEDAQVPCRLLAVLTYDALWLFERPSDLANYLEGKKSFFPVRIRQCEAVVFDGDTFLISKEGGRLFELRMDALFPLQ